MILVELAAAMLALPGAAEPAQPPQPIGSPANWFWTDDYPIEAQRREAEGMVQFRLEVSAAGMPTRCIVEQSSNDVDLDRATCTILMQRARFQPARDRRARAIASSYSSRIRWVLPEPSTLPFEPIRYVTRIHGSADGDVRCSTNAAGDPRVRVATQECGALAGTGAAAFLRSGGIEATLTEIFIMIPEGRSDPAGDAPD